MMAESNKNWTAFHISLSTGSVKKQMGPACDLLINMWAPKNKQFNGFNL